MKFTVKDKAYFLPPLFPFLYLCIAFFVDGFFLRPQEYINCLMYMKIEYIMPVKFLLAYTSMFVSILLLLSLIFVTPEQIEMRKVKN